MSNSIQHRLSLVPETQYGVTPNPPPFQVVPIVSTTLALSRGSIESAITNPNRQVTDLRPGNRQVGGEIASEWMWGDLDKIIEAVFLGTWTPRATHASSGAQVGPVGVAADNTILSGSAQIEHIDVTASAAGGAIDLTVTSVELPGGHAINNVNIPADQDAAATATLLANALNNDGTTSNFFHASTIDATLLITKKQHLANDVAMNLSAISNVGTPMGAGWVDVANSTTDQVGQVGTLPTFNVGEPVQVFGLTGSGAGGIRFDVVSSTAGKLVLSGGNVSDTAGNVVVTVTSLVCSLTPGTTQRSFSVLREFTDLVAGGTVMPFQLYKGVMFNTIALTIKPEQIVQITFGAFGREYENAATAPVDSTVTDWSGSKPIDAFAGAMKVDNVVVSNITEITLHLENGITPRFVLFSDKSNTPKVGKTKVTGQMTAYFTDSVLLNAFNNGTEHEVTFDLIDPKGNKYTFTMANIQPTGGQTDTSQDNDITIPVPFQAIYDKESAVDAITVTRTPAALA